MSKLTGQELADFALTKLGTPYVYGAKGASGALTSAKLNSLISSYPSVFTNIYITKAKRLVGQVCCDCSGLISWYTDKVLGSAQLYSQAYTRLLIKDIDKFAPGVVLWKSGHVAVYVGDGKYIEVECKGIDYGCVKDDARSRGFEYGLTFSWMTYDYTEKVEGTWKGVNPYMEPEITISRGSTDEGVKWVQWELKEAGYDLDVDGDCGAVTDKYIRAFQQSCKLTVDGKVGPATRKAFKAD